MIINVNVNDIIHERLNVIKYDPITGKVYNESEINVYGKVNIVKKIYESLVNEVPDFANKIVFPYFKMLIIWKKRKNYELYN